MRLLRDILLIYRRQVRQSLRVPMTLVLGLLQPILYLLFFGPVFSRVSASFGTELAAMINDPSSSLTSSAVTVS